jgi:hypothetical protein
VMTSCDKSHPHDVIVFMTAQNALHPLYNTLVCSLSNSYTDFVIQVWAKETIAYRREVLTLTNHSGNRLDFIGTVVRLECSFEPMIFPFPERDDRKSDEPAPNSTSK